MHVLISGGTGFIGSALCRHLAQDGHSLTVLSRRPDQVPAICGASVRGVADLADLPAEPRVDAIINLAGASIAQGRWTEKRKQELVDSRVRTTRALVEFMARQSEPPACFLSASALGYYGAQGDEPLDEDAEPHCEYQHELCAAWESAAGEAQAQGVRTAIFRLGIVLGPGGGALANMLPPFRFGLGGPIGAGSQWMSWVHREDVLRAIALLLQQQELQGVFNLTAPGAVRNREFAEVLGRVLHRPAFLPMPGFVLRLLLGEFAHLLITGQRVVPRNLEAAGFEFRFPNLEEALQDIVGNR